MPAQTGKLFYKIGEVSRLAQVEPYILRYWENEFPVLSPRKSSGGQRVYQQKDLDLVLSIKRMLHEEGYTIAGARKKIAERCKGGKGAREAGADKDRGEGGKDAPGAVQMAAKPEPLELGIAAEVRAQPQKPAPKKVKRNMPQMSLPFFEAEDGIQDALVKFKAEIKELINLVK
ncbi:MAG: MerR family transcriptional regulator [Nitrospirota bacterium]